MDLQDLEDSYNMDSFVDFTFDFLEQETKKFKPLKIKISKLYQPSIWEVDKMDVTLPVSCASQ